MTLLSRSARALLACCLACWLVACSAPELRRFEFREAAMGTEFRLVLYAEEQQLATRAAALAFERIGELEACMSDYRAESELSRLPARARDGAGQVSVSEDLWRVLVAAREVSRSSGGAFDVTVGPFVRLWRRARRQERAPRDEALERAASAVGYELLEVDATQRSVRLRAPDMRLDLGGIAKGFALDEALRVLHAEGIESALVDGGGDVLVGAAPPGREGWRVGVDAAGERFVLGLEHAAVATSGDAYRYVELDGVRYSHIIDPRSGRALVRQATVSVVAGEGMLADAAASAASVLGPLEGLRWVESVPGLEARFSWLENGVLRTCASGGFGRKMAGAAEPSE